ncbi:MAG: hypothetical protein RBR22_03930 [Desulfuromonas sp.]|nr:hypothetical protein [Desulfuromonas sp.]
MEKNSLEEGLKNIKSKRLQLWCVFISYLPAIGLTLSLSSDNTGPAIVAGLWIIAAGVAGVRVSMCRCPQCGNLFHMRGISTSWGRSCRHCNLSL